MSAVMTNLEPPPSPQHKQPPRQITEEALREAGVADELADPPKEALALAAHFGFGTTMGAVYSLLPEKYLTRRPLTSGISFGLAVWTASYLGWLPAFGSRAAATEDSAQRNATMIVAHVVWGAALGYFTGQLLTNRDDCYFSKKAEIHHDHTPLVHKETAVAS
jgi:uncharacterized membrane protein YagU involved in acid resistance